MLLASMCRTMPFSDHALKEKIFFDIDIVVKTNWNVVYLGLYSHWQRVRVNSLLLNNFSYCFCMLSKFAKVFQRKVWRVQVVHLHNAALALSSSSRCFQLSTNLKRFLSLSLSLILLQKQTECGLAWHWWNSTDLGLTDMFLTSLNAEIVA